MAFSATVYNCADDPKKLEKTLETGITVSSIRPTEACDILNPTFVLDYNSSYTSCNYIVVGAPFNRSYFITDMKIDIGKKIEISCAVDVLETYKNSIKNLKCNIIRSESLKEPYLPDPEYKMYSDFQSYTILPSNEDIANLVVGRLDLQELNSAKQYIVCYVGGPRTTSQSE